MMTDLHIVEWGTGAPVVMVHGSFGWGEDTFGKQRPLSEHYRLMLVDRRGFGKSRSAERVDFDSDADDIAEIIGNGAHLVGHSYGAVVSLLAAARHPLAVKSLTVIEPPAYKIAMNDPVVESTVQWLAAVYAEGAKATPRQFYANFTRTDLNALPPLSDDDIRAIRSSMTERPPFEAEIPLNELASATFPKLIVSGGRERPVQSQGRALMKVCDVLEHELHACRVVIEGATHNPQLSHPELFNKALLEFLSRGNI